MTNHILVKVFASLTSYEYFAMPLLAIVGLHRCRTPSSVFLSRKAQGKHTSVVFGCMLLQLFLLKLASAEQRLFCDGSPQMAIFDEDDSMHIYSPGWPHSLSSVGNPGCNITIKVSRTYNAGGIQLIGYSAEFIYVEGYFPGQIRVGSPGYR